MAEHEPMAWLVAAVDQLFAKADDHPAFAAIAEATRPDVIFMMLKEPGDEAADWGPEEWAKWEFTCDNCGVYVPNRNNFWSGQYLRKHKGWKIIVGYGCCRKCRHAA